MTQAVVDHKPHLPAPVNKIGEAQRQRSKAGRAEIAQAQIQLYAVQQSGQKEVLGLVGLFCIFGESEVILFTMGSSGRTEYGLLYFKDIICY